MGKMLRIKKYFFICSFALFAFNFTFPCYGLNLDKVQAAFISGDYKTAISEGEEVLSGAKKDYNLDELYYFLGLSYLKEGNLLRASDIFEIIINEFEKSRFKDKAKLGLADTYYSVQVGAFFSAANANNLQQELVNSGYSAFVEETNSSDRFSYKVKVGKFRMRSDAEVLQAKLSNEGYPAKISP